jgi:phage FluMu protein gp41
MKPSTLKPEVVIRCCLVRATNTLGGEHKGPMSMKNLWRITSKDLREKRVPLTHFEYELHWD